MDFAIYPFKRHGKYKLYVRFKDPFGNAIDRSTGIGYGLNAPKKERAAAKKKAEEKAQKIIEEYFEEFQEYYREPSKNPRLKQFLKDDYYPYVKANCKPATLANYEKGLNHFLRICKDRPLNQYKRLDLERFKQYRYNKEDIRKTTINIEMRAIKAAFSWAYRYDLTDNNPFKGRGLMFETKPNRRAFTKEEISRLLDHTKGTNIGLVIRLTYYTGMRLGEVVSLTWDMVHLDEVPHLRITEENSKSKKGRNIPLGEKAYGVIENLHEVLAEKKRRYPKVYESRPLAETYVIQKQRGWGQYQIRSVQDQFRKVMNELGLPKELKFHCLRHAFATHILSNGGNLHGVSKIMGHSSPQVTSQFYDHTTALNFRETANLI